LVDTGLDGSIILDWILIRLRNMDCTDLVL